VRLRISRSWRRAFAWLGAVLLLLMLLKTVPVVRYRPNAYIYGCEKEAVDAPLRPFVADMLTQFLRQDRLLHLRVGDNIYTPVLGTTPWAKWRDGYVEYFANTDGKVARGIARGFIRSGQPRRVPASVERIIAQWEARHGERLERDRDGVLSFRAADRLASCALIRAALTTADDLPGDPPWP